MAFSTIESDEQMKIFEIAIVDNQEYRESFEKVSKETGMATGGVAIINYSYLKTKEYPTIGLELYSKGSSFPGTEEDIEKVVNFIIEAINDHDKTRK